MDRVIIQDLELRCIVGINPEERREKQEVCINITLYTDLLDAGRSDDIADTVNYKSIKLAVRDMVEASTCFLVEKLAAEIARICLRDDRVERVVVRVDKPGALRFARSVAVEIERTAADLQE